MSAKINFDDASKPWALLATALDSINQGILVYDENLTVIAFNRRALEILNLPTDRFAVGGSFEDWVHYTAKQGGYGAKGSARDRAAKRLAIARSFEPYRVDHTRADGRVIEVSGNPVPGGGYVTTYTDITQRKQSEAALRERTELVQLLNRMATMANEATSFAEALQDSLVEICEYIGWPVAHVYYYDDVNPDILSPSGIWHLSDPERYRSFKEVTERTAFGSGIGLPGRSMESGRPEWIADIENDPNFPRAEEAKKAGLKAGFACPVVTGSKIVAVLEFFTPDAASPDYTLLDSLVQVGTQLGRVAERENAEAELRKSQEFLRKQAATDPLTGARNRRSFLDQGTKELRRARRHRRPLSVLMIDIDHFKAINDRYGHAVGDDVLVTLVEACNGALREEDVFGRIGGEEFAVILIEDDLAAAKDVAERLRRTVEALEIDSRKGPLNFTVSIGISECRSELETLDEGLQRADRALYAAKTTGRNRAVVDSG